MRDDREMPTQHSLSNSSSAQGLHSGIAARSTGTNTGTAGAAAQALFGNHATNWRRYDSLYQGRKMPLQQSTCLDYFDEAVIQNPSAPAISMGGQTLNYAEVAFSVDALACWLVSDANIKPGDRVALYLPSNLSYMICILAAWRAQLIVTNLSFMLEKSHILHQLQDSGAKLLITIPDYLPRVEKILLQTSIRHIVTTQADDYVNFFGRLKTWLSPKKWLEQWREDTTMIRYVRLRRILSKYKNTYLEWPALSCNDIAMIQYTSGTTGAPKGVVLTHGNLSANYQQTRHILNERLDASKCGLCAIPLQHIVGVTFCLAVLSSGAHVVLTTIDELLHRPKNLQQYPLTLLVGVPIFYEQMLKHEASLHLIKNMELFLCGGSFVSRSLQKEWLKLTGRALCEAFGQSETASLVSINPPQRARVGTVGVVLPNTEVCIVGNKQQSLSFNQPGELWIKGPQVMRGYWQKPVITQQMITHDDWLKTGDIVCISEDGFITMLERKQDTVWWANRQIFPYEIERKICQHEDVVECAMIQDQDETRVRLLVVAKKGLNIENLKRHIGSLYLGILPDSIELVDHLPREAMGRVLRRLLRRSKSFTTGLPKRLTPAEPPDPVDGVLVDKPNDPEPPVR